MHQLQRKIHKLQLSSKNTEWCVKCDSWKWPQITVFIGKLLNCIGAQHYRRNVYVHRLVCEDIWLVEIGALPGRADGSGGAVGAIGGVGGGGDARCLAWGREEQPMDGPTLLTVSQQEQYRRRGRRWRSRRRCIWSWSRRRRGVAAGKKWPIDCTTLLAFTKPRKNYSLCDQLKTWAWVWSQPGWH